MYHHDCEMDHDHFNKAPQFRQLDEAAPMPINSAVIRVVLTLLLRAGLVLLQIGSIPVEANLILLHNTIDISWVSLCYLLVGEIIAFTGDFAGVIGGGYWIGHEQKDREQSLLGWQGAVVASGVAACCLAGRMHTVGTLIVTTLLAALVQPLVMHWAWSTDGWMTQHRLMGRDVQFVDSAGSVVIHAVGGLTGLVGCLVLGRKIDDVPSEAPGPTFLGNLLIIIGLQGLNRAAFDVGLCFVNIFVAMAACTTVTVALHFFRYEPFCHATVMRCAQAMTAGVVVVAAGAGVYPPYVAVALGAADGFLFYLVTKIIARSGVDDWCNVVAVHLASGLLGAAVPPFFKDDQVDVSGMLLNFAWHLVCVISAVGMVVTVMVPVFAGLEWCGVLRNRAEYVNYLRVRALLADQPRSLIQRLFRPDVETQLGAVPSRESETVTDSRSVKREPSEIELPDRAMIDRQSQQGQSAVKSRKLRSVHTIRSEQFDVNSINASQRALRRIVNSTSLNGEKRNEQAEVKVLVEPRFRELNSESEDERISEANLRLMEVEV